MTGARRWSARALAVLTAGVVCALVPASAAWGHGAHSPTATNYRTAITAVTPALDGVEVRMIEAGTGLELTNRTGRTIEVLGYEGEPYLQVRPDGTYENVRSPATHLNQDYTGATPVPPEADPQAAPSWRRVSRTATARWYDHRTHWMGAEPPPPAATEPGSTHRILDWTIPLRDGETAAEITGTLDWVPPPSPWPWWGAAAVATTALAALGLAAGHRLARAALGVTAALGGALSLSYLVARELDAGAGTVGEVLVWLATGQVWAVLSALAAIAAGGFLLGGLRRVGAPSEAGVFALAVAGACLTIFGGLAEAAVFARAVPPVPFDPDLARVAVLTVVAAGAGVSAAAALTLRRLRTHPG